MRFYGSFTPPAMNLKHASNSFRKQLDVRLRNAARAWLREVILKTPVYTGTALGTIKYGDVVVVGGAGQFSGNIGRMLQVSIPLTPVTKRKGRGPSVGGTHGHFEFDYGPSRWTFKFNTTLFYQQLNEFWPSRLPLRHSTPWHALSDGANAFKAVMRRKYDMASLIILAPRKLARI